MKTRTEQQESLLELLDITKLYHSKPALDGVSITVRPGAAITVFGPNGAGKTTLMKIMAGIMSAGSGKVLYRGKPAGDSSLQREVFYLGHKNGLYAGLTVLENLRFVAGLFDVKGDTLVNNVLKEHGLWERRNDPVRELSQGMKRRLAIAKSFLTEPSLLILDEPFAGLDLKWRGAVLQRIRELKAQGRALVIATHLVDEGHELGDYIAYLNKGSLQFFMPKEDISAEEIKRLFNERGGKEH